MKNNIILGGGFTGLFSALLLIEKFKVQDVFIIDYSPEVGGAYLGCQFDKKHHFDFGPHLFYESDNDEINKLISSLLKGEEWLFLEENKKDIPGIYYNGVLQENSHYIDIRAKDTSLYKESIADLFINIDSELNDNNELENAKEYFINKFGNVITDKIINNVTNKLWHKDLDAMDWFIARLVSMDRIIAFNESSMLDFMKSEKIRDRIAYPNQFSFPSTARTNKQRALYPKEFGFFRVIDALKNRLIDNGVKIYTSTSIKSLTLEDKKIKAIELIDETSQAVNIIDNINHVHSTIDLGSIKKYLKINDNQSYVFDKHKQVAYVFMNLAVKPMMGALYYFYVYDTEYKTFRVTDYSNYCENASENGEYPICVELHFNSDEDCENLDFSDLAIQELLSMGIILDEKSILFKENTFLKNGFPLPTLNNKEIISNTRKLIEEESISNLTLSGIALDKRLFFLHDILEDSYNLLCKRFADDK